MSETAKKFRSARAYEILRIVRRSGLPERDLAHYLRHRCPIYAPEEASLSETTAFLLLDVLGVPCAIAQASVSEVLPMPRLYRTPTGGGPLAGFLNLGGVPVPVVDLAGLFGLRAASSDLADDPYRHLVLSADRGIAFLVDRVEDLVRVDAGALRPVPDDRTLNGCVVAEIAVPKGLVHVLDFSRLLTREERLRIDAHARAAADRLSAFTAPPA